MPEPEIHQIILDEMDNLQGENVTGEGLAERVITATDTAHETADPTNKIKAKLEEGVVLIQDGYNVNTLTVWVEELEALLV